jgi:hypothetical protein
MTNNPKTSGNINNKNAILHVGDTPKTCHMPVTEHNNYPLNIPFDIIFCM